MSTAPETGTETAEHGLPVATPRDTARGVWRLSGSHRARILPIVVLGVASTAVNLIPPVAIGRLIDTVQHGTADFGDVLAITSIMAAAAVVGTAGMAIATVLASRLYQAVLAGLREQLVGHAFALPQHLVEQAGTGDLISRTSDDVTAVADAAPAVIGVVTGTTFTVVVSLAGLVTLQWQYAAAFVVVLPVSALAMRWYLRTGPPLYRAERAAMSVRAQEIVESQRGHATVVGFGLGGQRHHAVMTASWGVAVQALRARTVQSMFSARLNLAECLSLAAVLVTGFVLIDHGISTAGAATTAMLLVLRLLDPINQLLFVTDTVQSAAVSLSRMIGVITVADDDARPPRVTDDATVRLHEVAFHYGDEARALDDINLDIAAGEHVAVVGASGAGKTTLAAVIAGVHRAGTGTVARPSRTVLIAQEVHVFAGTMRDNLTLAAPDASDVEICAALDATLATSVLDDLPEGLDTRIGAGGQQLTDARAQQIALVRLVLADPALAILDEATAESGSNDSKLLDRTMTAALRGRTGLVIAHRLSQASTCDRIVVMQRGRIIEAGTHGELIRRGGVYAELWQACQATGVTSADAGPGRPDPPDR